MAIEQKTAGDKTVVSTLAQSAANVAATADRGILFDEDSRIEIERNDETDEAEKTGEVEATQIQKRDRTASGTLTLPKATPDALAWASAFAYSDHAAIAAGTGYLHTSKLLTYPDEPSYFTLVHRHGGSGVGSAPAALRRHVGLGLASYGLRYAIREFLVMTLGVAGTGNFDDSIRTQTISAAGDGSADLVIAADPINDDPTNIQVWADTDEDGQFETRVTINGYTQGTKAIDIADPGGPATAINYRVIYAVEVDEAGYTWADVGSIVPAPEFQLKAANLQIVLGGVYSEPGGVPTITGGEEAACELRSLDYTCDHQSNPASCWRQGATEIDHGQRVDQNTTVQTLEFERRVADWFLKGNFDANTPIAAKLDAIGPEYEPGQRFLFEQYFPRLGILENDLQVSDGRWVEAGNLRVLKDVANGWATAVTRVRNLQPTYLAP